jgi:hypothetical protein
MQAQLPMDRVPALQSFPEMGFPIAAYYGIDSSLATMQQNSASSSTPLGNMTSGSTTQVVFTVLGVVLVGYILFHVYQKIA